MTSNFETIATIKIDPRRQAHLLSERELEVLHWLAEGKTDREIAKILGKSVNTVRNQVHSILEKMRAQTRTHAAAKAVALGLLRLDSSLV